MELLRRERLEREGRPRQRREIGKVEEEREREVEGRERLETVEVVQVTPVQLQGVGHGQSRWRMECRWDRRRRRRA